MRIQGDAIVLQAGDVVSVKTRDVVTPHITSPRFTNPCANVVESIFAMDINGEEYQVSRDGSRIRKTGPIVQLGNDEGWRIIYTECPK